MPPKQVYGKRVKPTTTATARYAKFLSSPDMSAKAEEKGDAGIGETGERDGDGDDVFGDGLGDVEERMKGMSLGVEEKEKVKDAKPKGKNKGTARTKEGVDVEVDDLGEVEKKLESLRLQPEDQPSRKHTTKHAVSVAIPLERKLESLALDEDIIIFDDKGEKTGKVSRKALGNRDTNAAFKSQEVKIRDRRVKETEAIANTKGHTFGEEQTSNKTDHEPAAPVTLEPGTENGDAEEPSPLPTTAKKSKGARKQTPEPMIYSNDPYTAYVSPLLSLSDQRSITSFDEWSQNLDDRVNVEKIAEASFSEVYRLTIKDPVLGTANESVLKLVGLKMPPEAPLPSECVQADRARRKGPSKTQLDRERQKRQEDDEWKSNVEDVHGEVRLLQNLNYIPGFTIFRDITILQGRPSSSFARAWKEWNKARPKGKKSHYPDPAKKASYEDTQLWAVIEMQDAGTDCGKIIEAGGISTIWEVWDIFWGVCLSVAKAEEACRFEHRDLHMDNICVRSSEKGASLTEPRVRNPLKRKLGFTCLETTVIDYTLSRADILNDSPSHRNSSDSSASCPSPPATPTSHSSRREHEVAYLDLDKDQGLFEGDADEEYQYEIYRYMWGAVYHNDPLNQNAVEPPHLEIPETPRRSPRKHTDPQYSTPRRSPRKNNTSRFPPDEIWKHFHPKTNLVWAHFILYSLLQNLTDNNTEPASLSVDEIMAPIDVRGVQSSDIERIQRKAIKLHKILVKVASLLEPEMLGRKARLESMGGLVVLALEAGWLGEGDVRGEGV